ALLKPFSTFSVILSTDFFTSSSVNPKYFLTPSQRPLDLSTTQSCILADSLLVSCTNHCHLDKTSPVSQLTRLTCSSACSFACLTTLLCISAAAAIDSSRCSRALSIISCACSAVNVPSSSRCLIAHA